MRNTFRSLGLFIILMLAFCCVAIAQSDQTVSGQVVLTTGTTSATYSNVSGVITNQFLYQAGSPINYHQLLYRGNSTFSVSACTYEFDGSNDNATWTSIISSTSCTTGSGFSTNTQAAWNYYRIRLLTFTDSSGSSNITFVYVGSVATASSGGSVVGTTGQITATTAAGTTTLSLPNPITIPGNMTMNGVISFPAGLGGVNTIVGPPDHQLDIIGGTAVQSTSGVTGKGINLFAANGVAGTSVGGGADGGAISILAGTGENNTSGNSSGGSISITVGGGASNQTSSPGTIALTGGTTIAPQNNSYLNAWGTTGAFFAVKTAAGNFQDITSSGTVANMTLSSFAAATLKATSATTYTNAANVYIAGPPAAGSGATFTNAYSLLIPTGAVGFQGIPSSGTSTGYICDASIGLFVAANCTVSIASAKHDISMIDRGLDLVMQLSPTKFTYNDPAFGKGQHFGFVADDYVDNKGKRQLGATHFDKRLGSYDSKGELKGFEYEFYTAVLTKAIQQQQNEIRILQAICGCLFIGLIVTFRH